MNLSISRVWSGVAIFICFDHDCAICAYSDSHIMSEAFSTRTKRAEGNVGERKEGGVKGGGIKLVLAVAAPVEVLEVEVLTLPLEVPLAELPAPVEVIAVAIAVAVAVAAAAAPV